MIGHFSTPSPVNAPVVASPAPLISIADLASLDDAGFVALGCKHRNDKISDYAPDFLPKFSKSQLLRVTRNLAITTTATSSSPPKASIVNPILTPSPAPILSPPMTAVLSTNGSSEFTYRGSLEFLELQICFDSVFPHPAQSQFGTHQLTARRETPSSAQFKTNGTVSIQKESESQSYTLNFASTLMDQNRFVAVSPTTDPMRTPSL